MKTPLRSSVARFSLASAPIVALTLGVGGVAGSTGCQKLLFKPDDPRTQFEVHDRMRQRYVPIEEEDVFGEPQPALRARLSPNT